MMFKRKVDWNFFLRLAIFNGDVVDISHQSSATKGSLQPDSRSSHKQNKPVPLDVQENPGLLTENETCQFCFNEFFRFVIFSSIFLVKSKWITAEQYRTTGFSRIFSFK